MAISTTLFVAVIVLVLLGLVVFNNLTYVSGFTFNNSEYSYSNPDTVHEWDYYGCIKNECGGNTHDYDCLEKCHLKAFRKGMDTMDTKDWVCLPYANDEDAYYRCLDNAYADYKYP